MSRKRRSDAKRYEFHLFNCGGLFIQENKKVYMYEAVLIRKAKEITGYEQPVFSLYRDLHKAKSVKDIYGMRAICLEDFNNEGFCCKVFVDTAPGKSALFVRDEL